MLLRRDMVVLPTDKLLHWFGSGAMPQSMSPPGFGARLLAIAPSSNQQLPEDCGTHASVGEQVRREGGDDGSMSSSSICDLLARLARMYEARDFNAMRVASTGSASLMVPAAAAAQLYAGWLRTWTAVAPTSGDSCVSRALSETGRRARQCAVTGA